MSIQKQWSDFHLCDMCNKQFDSSSHVPLTLVCGHTYCKKCLSKLKNRQCLHDKNVQIPDLANIPANHAILKLLDQNDVEMPASVVKTLEANEELQQFEKVKGHMEELAMFLKPLLDHGVQALNLTHLTRPMLKKLVTIVNSQLVEVDGRVRVMRTAKSLADRTITELLIIHQGQQQLSHQLWAAVRLRGCQFLGPVMQEETLKYIQKVLETGQALSRKNIVLYVVEQLEKQFPQASRTSVGHVVQLLYRSSCFNVDKRDGDSSLMQLKEEYRNHDALRKEHDTQIVKIAMEAGLRIGPEQWSSLLYGDQKHKSHMQSIIDKLIAMGCTSSGVNELVIALERAQDPYNLSEMVAPLEELLNRKLGSDKNNNDKMESLTMTEKTEIFSMEACAHSLELLTVVIRKFVEFMKQKQKPNNNETVGGVVSQQMLGAKYKTGLCRDVSRPGGCPRGSNCTYAHSQDELERYRVISQQNRGKTKMQQTLTDKPRTSPLTYKPPINLTPSLPVTQSYQPPAYYSDPAVYSPDHDPHMSRYSGEQLVSRGAPTKPSPPSTSTYHELQMSSGGYSDVYIHGMATKYEPFKEANPSIFTTTGTSMLAGSYGNSELYHHQQQQSANSLSAIRCKREKIKQMLEQEPNAQLLGINDGQDDDQFTKPSSLPNDFYPDEVGSSRNSTTASDEETDVGFINKTRSFPDLSKNTHAQQQQALAIKEAKLRKREEAIQQKELHLQRQNEVIHRGYPRVYSGEQPMYTNPAGYNWSGAMAYTGQQSSQPPYIYHSNKQQWSRPHGNITQELNHMSFGEPGAVLMPHVYDNTQCDAGIAHYVANQEQRKYHLTPAGYGPTAHMTGYHPSLGAATAYDNSGYAYVQKFQ